MTSPIISSPHLCKETGSSSSSRAATEAGPLQPGSEPSAADCPFCSEPLDITFEDEEMGVAWGDCAKCKERVAVDL